MPIEFIVLFNYKNYDILVREIKNKYIVGMRGEAGVNIWFEKTRYNSFKLARTSGRDYVRIMIDKIILSRK